MPDDPAGKSSAGTPRRSDLLPSPVNEVTWPETPTASTPEISGEPSNELLAEALSRAVVGYSQTEVRDYLRRFEGDRDGQELSDLLKLIGQEQEEGQGRRSGGKAEAGASFFLGMGVRQAGKAAGMALGGGVVGALVYGGAYGAYKGGRAWRKTYLQLKENPAEFFRQVKEARENPQGPSGRLKRVKEIGKSLGQPIFEKLGMTERHAYEIFAAEQRDQAIRQAMSALGLSFNDQNELIFLQEGASPEVLSDPERIVGILTAAEAGQVGDLMHHLLVQGELTNFATTQSPEQQKALQELVLVCAHVLKNEEELIAQHMKAREEEVTNVSESKVLALNLARSWPSLSSSIGLVLGAVGFARGSELIQSLTTRLHDLDFPSMHESIEKIGEIVGKVQGGGELTAEQLSLIQEHGAKLSESLEEYNEASGQLVQAAREEMLDEAQALEVVNASLGDITGQVEELAGHLSALEAGSHVAGSVPETVLQKVPEVVVHGGSTVGHVVEQVAEATGGSLNIWSGEATPVWEWMASHNPEFLRHSAQMATSLGERGEAWWGVARDLGFDESTGTLSADKLRDLAEAARTDPEAGKKLHELFHWAREGDKIKLPSPEQAKVLLDLGSGQHEFTEEVVGVAEATESPEDIARRLKGVRKAVTSLQSLVGKSSGEIETLRAIVDHAGRPDFDPESIELSSLDNETKEHLLPLITKVQQAREAADAARETVELPEELAGDLDSLARDTGADSQKLRDLLLLVATGGTALNTALLIKLLKRKGGGEETAPPVSETSSTPGPTPRSAIAPEPVLSEEIEDKRTDQKREKREMIARIAEELREVLKYAPEAERVSLTKELRQLFEDYVARESEPARLVGGLERYTYDSSRYIRSEGEGTVVKSAVNVLDARSAKVAWKIFPIHDRPEMKENRDGFVRYIRKLYRDGEVAVVQEALRELQSQLEQESPVLASEPDPTSARVTVRPTAPAGETEVKEASAEKVRMPVTAGETKGRGTGGVVEAVGGDYSDVRTIYNSWIAGGGSRQSGARTPEGAQAFLDYLNTVEGYEEVREKLRKFVLHHKSRMRIFQARNSKFGSSEYLKVPEIKKSTALMTLGPLAVGLIAIAEREIEEREMPRDATGLSVIDEKRGVAVPEDRDANVRRIDDLYKYWEKRNPGGTVADYWKVLNGLADNPSEMEAVDAAFFARFRDNLRDFRRALRVRYQQSWSGRNVEEFIVGIAHNWSREAGFNEGEREFIRDAIATMNVVEPEAQETGEASVSVGEEKPASTDEASVSEKEKGKYGSDYVARYKEWVKRVSRGKEIDPNDLTFEEFIRVLEDETSGFSEKDSAWILGVILKKMLTHARVFQKMRRSGQVESVEEYLTQYRDLLRRAKKPFYPDIYEPLIRMALKSAETNIASAPPVPLTPAIAGQPSTSEAEPGEDEGEIQATVRREFESRLDLAEGTVGEKASSVAQLLGGSALKNPEDDNFKKALESLFTTIANKGGDGTVLEAVVGANVKALGVAGSELVELIMSNSDRALEQIRLIIDILEAYNGGNLHKLPEKLRGNIVGTRGGQYELSNGMRLDKEIALRQVLNVVESM